MLILSAVQAIFATAFLLFGLVTLFGIGITGLLFLAPGALFAVTAATTQERSRAATAAALAVDAGLAYMAVRKLEALRASGTTDIRHHGGIPGLLDYLVPSAALLLVGIAVLAVLMDWRALRKAPWFQDAPGP